MHIEYEGNSLIAHEDRSTLIVDENFIYGNLVATITGELRDRRIIDIFLMELLTIASLPGMCYIDMEDITEADEDIIDRLIKIRMKQKEKFNLSLINIPVNMKRSVRYKELASCYHLAEIDLYHERNSRDEWSMAVIREKLRRYLSNHADFQTRHANIKEFRTSKVEDNIQNKGETFQEYLLRIIDEKGMQDVQVYKNANISRKLFSKIRCNPDYLPTKKTVVALALALELELPEGAELLQRAGYALSPGNIFDIIIKYCFENKIYNIINVNELLFDNGQTLIGE